MKKCPNGMYSEIKYDGERVQVHKHGDHFSYFSRSLKPVLPHKVRHRGASNVTELSAYKLNAASQVSFPRWPILKNSYLRLLPGATA